MTSTSGGFRKRLGSLRPPLTGFSDQTRLSFSAAVPGLYNKTQQLLTSTWSSANLTAGWISSLGSGTPRVSFSTAANQQQGTSANSVEMISAGGYGLLGGVAGVRSRFSLLNIPPTITRMTVLIEGPLGSLSMLQFGTSVKNEEHGFEVYQQYPTKSGSDSSSARLITMSLSQFKRNLHEVSYTPQFPGIYKISIILDQVGHVRGSPYVIKVFSPSLQSRNFTKADAMKNSLFADDGDSKESQQRLRRSGDSGVSTSTYQPRRKDPHAIYTESDGLHLEFNASARSKLKQEVIGAGTKIGESSGQSDENRSSGSGRNSFSQVLQLAGDHPLEKLNARGFNLKRCREIRRPKYAAATTITPPIGSAQDSCLFDPIILRVYMGSHALEGLISTSVSVNKQLFEEEKNIQKLDLTHCSKGAEAGQLQLLQQQCEGEHMPQLQNYLSVPDVGMQSGRGTPPTEIRFPMTSETYLSDDEANEPTEASPKSCKKSEHKETRHKLNSIRPKKFTKLSWSKNIVPKLPANSDFSQNTRWSNNSHENLTSASDRHLYMRSVSTPKTPPLARFDDEEAEKRKSSVYIDETFDDQVIETENHWSPLFATNILPNDNPQGAISSSNMPAYSSSPGPPRRKCGAFDAETPLMSDVTFSDSYNGDWPSSYYADKSAKRSNTFKDIKKSISTNFTNSLTSSAFSHRNKRKQSSQMT